ncbi:MAG: HAD-IIB family hydrolase [Lactobacillaceae bacterium]|jgi:Cof subfamily protein (haloacid dehalogenase superfamily)|nr:HAD-IIB family hydrolase [Lactobacillaceae bacterium]
MTLKIIASDMDGTFLREHRYYDIDRFSEQLNFMQQKGIHFVAASGNKMIHLKEIFQPVINKGYEISYVASNGSASYQGEKLIHAAFLTKEQIKKVIEWNANHPENDENLVILTGLVNTYVSNHASQEMIELIKNWYHDVTQVEKFKNISDDILEVTFLWEHDNVEQQVKMLREQFGQEVHSTGSGFGNVDVLAPNTNKATGMSFLQERWNVLDDEVVTFGDNENDLEMLLKFPRSFVMKNADESMHKLIPNSTKKTNIQDGVLDTIDELLSDL